MESDAGRDDPRGKLLGKLDRVQLHCASHAEHVPFLFQAGAAYFVRPDFDASAGSRSLEIARQVIAPHTSTATGVAQASMWHRVTGSHTALRPASIEETNPHTLKELKAWFEPQLASAPLEIGVIGDFDPAVVIEACAKTFGALPARATRDPFAEQRRVAFPSAPFSETLTFNGPKGLAVVTLAWPTPEAVAFPTQLHAHVLSAVLTNRIYHKLRTKMGETYSPRASLATEDGLVPAVAFVRCSIEAAPERVERVAKAAREVAADLARQGATSDEFERARRPFVRDTESGLRNNQWWFDVVAAAQSNPGYGAGWARALPELQSVTVEQINALARTVLAPDRLCQLLVLPK